MCVSGPIAYTSKVDFVHKGPSSPLTVGVGGWLPRTVVSTEAFPYGSGNVWPETAYKDRSVDGILLQLHDITPCWQKQRPTHPSSKGLYQNIHEVQPAAPGHLIQTEKTSNRLQVSPKDLQTKIPTATGPKLFPLRVKMLQVAVSIISGNIYSEHTSTCWTLL